MADVSRSSSLVENLNSRLRTDFTLRRHLGGSYLDLLRVFLNHAPSRPAFKDRTHSNHSSPV